jgi:hypothetical protein
VLEVRPAADTPAALTLALSLAVELQAMGFCVEIVPSRRPAGRRWRIDVDPHGGERRYVMCALPHGEQQAAASLDRLVGLLGRARC